MHSLYYVLTDQHREEFAPPVRCNEQTVTRLVRYFEDVVTENRLSALVLEGRCLNGDAERERKRLDSLTNASRRVYLFSCDGECVERTWKPDTPDRLTAMQECDYHGIETGPFILVMEPRFCGLLASSLVLGEKNSHTRSYDMVWTFDPNVVFTAIEYLMARVGVQTPRERQIAHVRSSSTPPRLRSRSGRISLSELIPSRPMSRLISAERMLMAWLTPASPAIAAA